MPPERQENVGTSFSTRLCKCDVPSGIEKETREDAEENKTQVTSLVTALADKCTLNITEVNLAGQRLNSLPDDDFTNLLVLNLSTNELTELPDKLKTATRLRVLNVSHNKLSTYPSILLDGLRMLKTLNLSFNSLITLPLPACAQHLKELSARSCNILDFPLWILYQFHALESLDLSVNPVFEFFSVDDHRPPHSSCRLLKRLNVANTYLNDHCVNKLCRFFPGLEFLDVSTHGFKYSNRIIDSAQFVLANNVKVIKACNIGLASSPKFPEVEKVNLSGNPVSWINEDFPTLSVKMLVLADCFLCSLPHNFGDMINLEYLNISNNDVGDLPTSFTSLLKLKHLDLYKNSLTSFPEVLVGLEKLRCFDVCQNYFDPPDHPTGVDRPSYAELRKTLRSSLSAARLCGPRLTQYEDGSVNYNDPGYGLSSSESNGSLSISDFLDENKPADMNDVPKSNSCCQEGEEDWGAIDDDQIYSDFPAPVYEEIVDHPNVNFMFRPLLRYVPDRLRDSPMFFHRIDPRVIPPTRDVMSENFVDGQFDDA